MATRALHDFDDQTAAPTGATRFVAPAPATPATPDQPRHSFDGPTPRSRLIAIVAVVVLHAAVIGAILTHRVMVAHKRTPEALSLLEIPAAPPPPQEAPKVVIETPPVVIPPPVFEVENPPPSITAVVSENPPPPQPTPPVSAPVVQGPPSPAPARPPAIVSGVDLSASMVQAVPPRYPYESRRLKEQGTVVLDVLLGLDGRVERCAVRTSSGFVRLDNAALEAVRRWRWSPTHRDGVAVAVRGLVEIPFILSPRDGGRDHGRRGGEPHRERPERPAETTV